MITFRLAGGLANKMFQYAFSLRIKHFGYDIDYIEDIRNREFKHEETSIKDYFNNVSFVCNRENKWKLAGQYDKISKMLKILSKHYIIERGYQYKNNYIQQISEPCCFDGAWQDERYFKDIEKDVRYAFEFQKLESERNLNLVNEMNNNESVAIHIRKGDGYGSWNIFRGTCTKEYYNNAIDYINRHVESPQYYVFTDCPETANFFLNLDKYTLINWNPKVGTKNHIDMQLMSYAKHNVIANSTYSWWGAWLNNNPNKIIIAPKDWFNPNSKLTGINHIIPEKWIKL